MSELEELYEEIAACTRCSLYQSATRAVPGEGPEDATVMFIGEAPGWHEDQQGRPFVGPAGQFLNELLLSVGWKREQVYITNVIKHRPPNNRDPLPSEIAACRLWLDRQLALIKPKVIVILGRHSLGSFFPGESISRLHGVARKRDDTTFFAMYHPAAALHQQSLRRTIEEDMRKLLTVVTEGEAGEEQPQQLSLF